MLGQRTLKGAMLARLMDCGTWMSREALAKGASTSPAAIDDALADLVLEKKAEFRQAVGYRLAGGELARAAAKQLRAGNLRRAVCARQVKEEYRVGVAEARDGLGLVMFELAMPMPKPGPLFVQEHMRLVNQIIEFTKGGL